MFIETKKLASYINIFFSFMCTVNDEAAFNVRTSVKQQYENKNNARNKNNKNCILKFKLFS